MVDIIQSAAILAVAAVGLANALNLYRHVKRHT